jgi:hypothetical protein
VEHGMDHMVEGWVICLWAHEFNGDVKDQDLECDDGIIEFDGLMNMEQSDINMGAIVSSNDIINSLTQMERALAQLVTTMQKITNECKEGDVTFCEHATSHMGILTCNIRNICFTKANENLHPGLMLHRVKDGLGNSFKQFK